MYGGIFQSIISSFDLFQPVFKKGGGSFKKNYKMAEGNANTDNVFNGFEI